jgi:hypothetical protein
MSSVLTGVSVSIAACLSALDIRAGDGGGGLRCGTGRW